MYNELSTPQRGRGQQHIDSPFKSAMVWPTWLHLFGFSPLCVFKCALKASALEEA